MFAGMVITWVGLNPVGQWATEVVVVCVPPPWIPGRSLPKKSPHTHTEPPAMMPLLLLLLMDAPTPGTVVAFVVTIPAEGVVEAIGVVVVGTGGTIAGAGVVLVRFFRT